MVVETRICVTCGVEKELNELNYRLSKYYYRKVCILCHNKWQKEKARIKEKAIKKNQEKINYREELFKKKKLDGSKQLYYDNFCSCLKKEIRKDDAMGRVKAIFCLNIKYLRSLVDNEFIGKGNNNILDYANPSKE